MPKKIERGDWLTLQVQVLTTWEDDTVTFAHSNGQKVTIRFDSDEIVDVIQGEREKPRRRKLFDKPD